MLSLPTHISIQCRDCRERNEVTCWVLVDGGTRPDLVGRIIRGNLQEVTCPRCSRIHRLELPVLVFRQETSPTLVFSPSRAMNDSENTSRRDQLIRILKTQIETFELRGRPRRKTQRAARLQVASELGGFGRDRWSGRVRALFISSA